MLACETPWAGMTMKDDDQVSEWKEGLPTNEELTPLSQSLISPVLACAFGIKHEVAKARTPAEVQRQSRATIRNLCNWKSSISSFELFPTFQEREDAGAYGNTAECGHDEGEGKGQGQRGQGLAGSAAEGRGDGRGDGRGNVRGDARGAGGDCGPRVGNGGIGSSDGAGAGRMQSHSAGAYPPAHAGHAMPAAPGPGSEGTSYNPGDGRPEQGSLPYMFGSLPYGAYERRSESSYGGRGEDSNKGGGSSKNTRKLVDSDLDDTDSGGGPVNSNEDPSARTLKRPRLVWTPQLHKRFVDAVGHLGIKNAVPKTIMQLMNVEGLTRENVASHLQKYRLYLKRMQGLSNEGPSSSDQLFASTPLPPGLGGPHYMSSQRVDVGPPPFTSPSVRMPFQGIGPGPLGPAHFGGYEHNPYGAMGRGFMQRPLMNDQADHILETENHNHLSHSHSHHNHNHNHSHNHSANQPNSPPQRILSLFPTTSH